MEFENNNSGKISDLNGNFDNRELFKKLPSRNDLDLPPRKKVHFADANGKTKGKKVLGVEFAPVNIPMERRLQTLAVFLWINSFMVMGPISVVLGIYLIFTQFWWIPLLYTVWYFYDRSTPETCGRKISWLRNARIWKYYVKYFPIKLVKTEELDPKKNYLFCVHPHGVLCSGAFGNFATEGNDVAKIFPGHSPHIITLDLHYSPWFAINREFIMGLGGISASVKSLNSIFNFPGGGQIGVLMVGGAPESLECHPGSYVVHLKKRKGFIKVALRQGGNIVPVFSFGETNIYDQVPNPRGSLLRRIQDRIQTYISLAPVIIVGRGIFQYSFGILPMRKPITTVVGKPIELPKISNPTLEDVNKWHEVYVNALQKLFHTHKDEYDLAGAELELI